MSARRWCFKCKGYADHPEADHPAGPPSLFDDNGTATTYTDPEDAELNDKGERVHGVAGSMEQLREARELVTEMGSGNVRDDDPNPQGNDEPAEVTGDANEELLAAAQSWAQVAATPLSTDERQEMAREGMARRDAAVSQVRQAASEVERQELLEAVGVVALRQAELTSDDVWFEARAHGAHPREPRLLGAIMKRAEKAGVIRPTDRYLPSLRPETHRNPKRVWRSLVYRA